MNRSHFLAALDQYKSEYADEMRFVESFRELLHHRDAYRRDHLPGHMTGSAWIIDPAAAQVLLTHHAKLNRWLQPGGHADGNEDILGVALSEAQEETGLTELRLFSPAFFDLDIHPIPERNGFPEHLHFDVRFVFIADPSHAIVVTEESHDLRWVDLDDIESVTDGNKSMIRMALKTASLLTADQQKSERNH